MKAKFSQACGLMTLGCACAAAFGFFAKAGTAETTLAHAVFLRFFLPLLLFVVPYLGYLVFRRATPYLNRPFRLVELKWPICRAAALVIGQYSLFYYLTKGTLVDAILLWNTAPLFIPLLERIFLGHRITLQTWISLSVSFCGVGLIVKPTEGLIDGAALIGLMSGLGMAVSQLILTRTAKVFSTLDNLLHLFFFTTLLTLGILIFQEGLSLKTLNTYFIEPLSNLKYFPLFLGMAFSSFGNQLFRTLALQRVDNAAALAPVMYSAIVFAAFFDWLVFDNLPDWLTIVGSILIIGPILVLHFTQKRQSLSTPP